MLRIISRNSLLWKVRTNCIFETPNWTRSLSLVFSWIKQMCVRMDVVLCSSNRNIFCHVWRSNEMTFWILKYLGVLNPIKHELRTSWSSFILWNIVQNFSFGDVQSNFAIHSSFYILEKEKYWNKLQIVLFPHIQIYIFLYIVHILLQTCKFTCLIWGLLPKYLRSAKLV